MNRKKIYSFLVLSLAAVFSMSPFALAAAATQTGYASSGSQTEKIGNKFQSDSFNQEMVYNEMLGAVNAGSNDRASIAGQLQNELNFTEVNYDADMAAEGAASASNSNTGCKSCNKAEAELENEIDVENSNLAWIMNLLKLKASGGKNKGGGSSAGAAKVDVSVKNSANANMTDIASSLNGAVLASNSNTGAHSKNKAEAELENEIGENKNCGSHYSSYSCQKQCPCPTNSPCPTTCPSHSPTATSTPDESAGDAQSNVEVTNMANSNETNIEIDFEPAMVAAYNANTGYGSSNIAEAELENEIDVENYNMAFITNEVKNEANSGNSDSGRKSWSGNSQSAGDASAETEINNYANSNKTAISADFGGDIIASNTQTGCESYNNAEVEVKNEIEVENENFAEIHNYVKNSANSGEDKNGKNKGCRGCYDGNSSSGDATSSVQITNQLNMNETEISVDLGGDVSAANTMTGAKSENNSQTEVKNSIEAVNKNFAEVSNYVVVASNTGNNSSDYSRAATQDNGADSGASLIITNQSNKNVVKVE